MHSMFQERENAKEALIFARSPKFTQACRDGIDVDGAKILEQPFSELVEVQIEMSKRLERDEEVEMKDSIWAIRLTDDLLMQTGGVD